MDLNGALVVITGGSRGIGAELGRQFANEGAKVVLVSRSESNLSRVAAEIGGAYHIADLTNPDIVDSLVDDIAAIHGPIDVFVNNAGVETIGALVNVEAQALRNAIRLNLEASFMLSRHVTRHMLRRGQGHLVNMSSLLATIAVPGLASYCGTKAGIAHFSETLRRELKGTRVRLTVVAPGAVATVMMDRLGGIGQYHSAVLERFKKLSFLPQVQPEEVAAAAIDAVKTNKELVRIPARYLPLQYLTEVPRRLVRATVADVDMVPRISEFGDLMLEAREDRIWPVDNEASARWPLYTRGNVAEVFPEVVYPLTWSAFGVRAEQGWRRAFIRMGLIQPGDLEPGEQFTLLGCFGGYLYVNASFIRLLGVRAPGASLAMVDVGFFGDSTPPPYEARKGDRSLRSTRQIARELLKNSKKIDFSELQRDRQLILSVADTYPGDDASDEDLLTYFDWIGDSFSRVFERHIYNTFMMNLAVGTLTQICERVGARDQVVTLLSGIGNVDSTQLATELWLLARRAEANPVVRDHFGLGVSGALDRLRTERSAQDWCASFDDFISRYGARGPNEWDQGSETWAYRPDLVMATIDQLRKAPEENEPLHRERELRQKREEVTEEVRSKLNAIERRVFDRVLATSHRYSRAREMSKTTAVMSSQNARRVRVELSKRIIERGGPRDRLSCALLTRSEFEDALSNPSDYVTVAGERRMLYEQLSALEPPHVFRGEVPPINTWVRRELERDYFGRKSLSGLGGAPGVVRGVARVINSPEEIDKLNPGDIMVAPMTDPSWTPLFLACSAVVVDVGSVMSHAVIVSRELGIPCVVGTKQGSSLIPDGAEVEVDGAAGEVILL